MLSSLKRFVGRLILPDLTALHWRCYRRALQAKGLRGSLLRARVRRLQRKQCADIPIKQDITPFTTPHGLSGIFISKGAVIGEGCTLFQQVTVGSNTLQGSARYGAPVIGKKRLYRCGRQNHRPRHGGRQRTHWRRLRGGGRRAGKRHRGHAKAARAAARHPARQRLPPLARLTKNPPRAFAAQSSARRQRADPPGASRGTRPLPDASPESSRPCGAVGKKGSLPVGAAPAHRRAKREHDLSKQGAASTCASGAQSVAKAPALPRRIAPGVLEAARLAESLKAQERGGREISLPPLSCVSSFL